MENKYNQKHNKQTSKNLTTTEVKNLSGKEKRKTKRKGKMEKGKKQKR